MAVNNQQHGYQQRVKKFWQLFCSPRFWRGIVALGEWLAHFLGVVFRIFERGQALIEFCRNHGLGNF